MDVLPSDDRGFVPLMEFRSIGKDEWIGFSTHLTVIPVEAMDYRSRQPAERRDTGPTGVYLEMEWGLDMDWYNHDTSWWPYIPLKPLAADGKAVSRSGSDWFFDFETSTSWEPTQEGHFVVPETLQVVIDMDLSFFFECIGNITLNYPFPFNSACPLHWDHNLLICPFPTIEELQIAGGTARRIAVDYLGFISWWTASISGWDANLDAHITRCIKEMELNRFQKRGVLVNWEKDWHEINIPIYIQHEVPLAYPWMASLASIPHFISLSPHVLHTYEKRRLEIGYELHSDNLPDLTDDLSIAKKYNQFLQDVSSNGRPDPDMEFDEGWCYYVVDFQGWSQCCIPLHITHEYYVLFTSTVSRKEDITVMLFRRWETLGNPATLACPIVALEDDPQGCMIRGADEIRELHKYDHAPVGDWHYDMDGWPSSAPSSGASSLSGRSHANASGSQESTLFTSRRWLCQMTNMDG